MNEDPKTISINPDDLVARLREVEKSAHGDIARLIELLLVENHILSLGQSAGFRRRIETNFSDFPRFLQIVDAGEPEKAEGQPIGYPSSS